MPEVVVDTHVKVLNETVRRRAIARGMDAIIYAPHYTPWPQIVDTAAHYSDEALSVIPARELFTGDWRHRKHVLALDLEAPVPDFLDLESTMAELADQDACVIAPHAMFLTMSLSSADVHRYQAAIDAVEIYNPKLLVHHRRRLSRLADRLDRPAVASSYAHLPGTVGIAATRIEADATSTSAIVRAITDGQIAGVIRPDRIGRWIHGTTEVTHLAWENTVSRLWRFASLEPVATHPTAPVYAGRFDAAG